MKSCSQLSSPFSPPVPAKRQTPGFRPQRPYDRLTVLLSHRLRRFPLRARRGFPPWSPCPPWLKKACQFPRRQEDALLLCVITEPAIGKASSGFAARPDPWQVADSVMEFGIGLCALLGGVCGTRAVQFLKNARTATLQRRVRGGGRPSKKSSKATSSSSSNNHPKPKPSKPPSKTNPPKPGNSSLN